MTHVIHEIPPVYDDRSKILILGSFPSVKSREGQFFYHHKQNRFWKVLAAVFEDTLPETIEEKKEFLLRHNIAIWDVIASCDIEGSSDSSIKNAVPNDFSFILKTAPIRQIYTNGGTAYKLYHKYCEKVTGFEPAFHKPCECFLFIRTADTSVESDFKYLTCTCDISDDILPSAPIFTV